MDASSARVATTKLRHDERRRHQRVGVMMMATLRATRGYFDCMVLNLSSGGAKVAFSDEIALHPGDAVTLIIAPMEPFRAQAVWQRANFVGLRFLDPPEAIDAALGSTLAN